jgi:peroxiredoxin
MNNMKKMMLLAALAVAFASCLSNGKKSEEQKVETKAVIVEAGTHAPDSVGYIVRVGDIAPEMEMELTDGQKVKLSDLRGKVVMLQFTASWCGVCRKEMPFIESDIWQKHKANPNFALYGIDRDEPVETVKAFAEKTGVTYPLALDPGADHFAKYADRKAGITRNVLIDKEGKIVMLTRLYNEEEFATLCKKIDEMLAE